MSPDPAATARSRIADHDAEIGAWAYVPAAPDDAGHPDAAASGGDGGALAGWPVGVKDLIDVRGMPTGCGAVGADVPPPARTDAACVAALRAAGATVVGKTTAVEYGWFGTVTTRNPRDPRRSPGGSSSGSAAAVAAGMCRAALGTQTAGSVIRPAAYCGVPAIKLSYGAVDRTGLQPAAPSLDSLGVFAGTIADLAAITAVLRGTPDASGGPGPSRTRPPRIGVVAEHFPALCDDVVKRAVDGALGRLAAAGADVVAVAPAVDWAGLARAHRTIMVREIARVHADRYRRDPGHFSADLAAAIAEGLAIGDAAYAQARETRDRARATGPVGDVDAWATPAATTLAPPAGQPGDPACNVAFTLLGLPVVALPVATDGALPAALQLAGPPGGDGELLRTAAFCAGPVRNTEVSDGGR